MIIGKFTAKGDDIYTGEIVMLGVHQGAHIRPGRPGERGPDYLVTVAGVEIGAAWHRTSKEGKPYVSVKLDSPMLSAPINCALTSQDDGSLALIWSRKPAEAKPAEVA